LKITKSTNHEALLINLDNNTSLNENELKSLSNRNKKHSDRRDIHSNDWLVEETEKWCKDRAIYIAVMDSIEVIDKKSQRSTGEIPELLKDALSVSFDSHIGHDVLKMQMQDLNSITREEEKTSV